MVINTRKSGCWRIGPRNNASCLPVSLSDGTVISCVDEMRYLGIFIVHSRTFKCPLKHAKKSFYRAANTVFAKMGRVASEEVTLQLITIKCLPVLLYGREACPLTKSDLQSLDFVINRFFLKLFTTKNIEIVKYCQEYFGLLYQVYHGPNVCLNLNQISSAFVCSIIVLFWLYSYCLFFYHVCLVNKRFSKFKNYQKPTIMLEGNTSKSVVKLNERTLH